MKHTVTEQINAMKDLLVNIHHTPFFSPKIVCVGEDAAFPAGCCLPGLDARSGCCLLGLDVVVQVRQAARFAWGASSLPTAASD